MLKILSWPVPNKKHIQVRLAHCKCDEILVLGSRNNSNTLAMLKPNKMELHLNNFNMIILRNILKILWVNKTILQIF